MLEESQVLKEAMGASPTTKAEDSSRAWSEKSIFCYRLHLRSPRLLCLHRLQCRSLAMCITMKQSNTNIETVFCFQAVSHWCYCYAVFQCHLSLATYGHQLQSNSSTLHECHRTFYAASLHLLQSIARVIACATELYAMSRAPSLRHSRTGTELNRPCEG